MFWLLGRIYCTGTPEDYKEVHALQDQMSVVPLSSYGKPYTPPPGTVDPSIDNKIAVRDQVNAMDGASYFKHFLTSYGLETRSCWILFLQKSLKSIQRAVSERWRNDSGLRSPFRRFVKDVFVFSGVSQISLSTPGVFLPEFSVTRRTARTLPLYEQVSRRCKAFTLPHLPAFVACTIRTWSRRTLWWMVGQLMAYHSAASRETAPTAIAVVICFAS
jgi:hypothetical protein